MTITANRRASIYLVEQTPDSLYAELTLIHRVTQFPSILLENRCKANTLFSPNFDRYLDVDFMKGHFVIRSVED
jgi:hypothetical protein